MGSSRARERQRIARACTRCRIKKVKCDGGSPCSCCKFQDAMCQYAERRHQQSRKLPAGYVEYLEKQREFLVQLVKEVWKSRDGSLAVKPTRTKPGHEPTLHEIIHDCGLEISVPDDFDPEDDSKSPQSNRPELSSSSGYESGRQTPNFDFDVNLKFEDMDTLFQTTLQPLHSSDGFTLSQSETSPTRRCSDPSIPSQHPTVGGRSGSMDPATATVDDANTLLPFDFNPSIDTFPAMHYAQNAPFLARA